MDFHSCFPVFVTSANFYAECLSPDDITQLRHLPLNELSNRPECDVLWEQPNKNSFVSFLKTPYQCTFMFLDELVRPEGTRNLTCAGISLSEVFVAINSGKIVSGTYEPYQLLRTVDWCTEQTTPPIAHAVTLSPCHSLTLQASFIAYLTVTLITKSFGWNENGN
ncbi:hypothetical protein PoB_002945200 [Plakobranchus ocellatus]|uniref:Uncharacterized protein n=1 Tax=Plakobranchus ocellatus TaxID=259542 RepID=A0AAV4A6P9_9GAST|nr:hypothetical protein PoB_002945200 [Plakobranchus ocellatus]